MYYRMNWLSWATYMVSYVILWAWHILHHVTSDLLLQWAKRSRAHGDSTSSKCMLPHSNTSFSMFTYWQMLTLPLKHIPIFGMFSCLASLPEAAGGSKMSLAAGYVYSETLWGYAMLVVKCLYYSIYVRYFYSVQLQGHLLAANSRLADLLALCCKIVLIFH